MNNQGRDKIKIALTKQHSVKEPYNMNGMFNTDAAKGVTVTGLTVPFS